ncbi:MAG: hypothetical protein M0R51_14565 [Clostridia bacterium]|jgi:hypothetical protein|nr:hypothetical protein [Clostridia bacterium]
MNFIKCENSTLYIASNGDRYIKCKKTGDACFYQRYCSKKRNFELTIKAENCKLNPKNYKGINANNSILAITRIKEEPIKVKKEFIINTVGKTSIKEKGLNLEQKDVVSTKDKKDGVEGFSKVNSENNTIETIKETKDKMDINNNPVILDEIEKEKKDVW